MHRVAPSDSERYSYIYQSPPSPAGDATIRPDHRLNNPRKVSTTLGGLCQLLRRRNLARGVSGGSASTEPLRALHPGALFVMFHDPISVCHIEHRDVGTDEQMNATT